MSASTPTTEITLHQLVLRIGDTAPEGHVFETEAAALVEAAHRARQHLDQFWETDARNILDDGDRQADSVVDLSNIADNECLRLANAWDGAPFEAIISPVGVEVTLAALSQAIRAAGNAVCIFQASDVASTIDVPDGAGEWLLSHCDELESALAQHGNEWLDMRLEYEGRQAPDPDDAPLASKAQQRAERIAAFHAEHGEAWGIIEFAGMLSENDTGGLFKSQNEAWDYVYAHYAPDERRAMQIDVPHWDLEAGFWCYDH